MAAPCVSLAFRHMSLKLAKHFINTGATLQHSRCFRKYVKQRCFCSVASSSPSPVEGERSKWDLLSAVCLERYPVISQEPTAIEKEYIDLLDAMEFENSLLSDHELQLVKDKDNLRRRQSGLLDENDDDDAGNLITALDLEDQYAEEMKRFKPASRTSVSDIHSVQRNLMDKLVLLVKCRLGDRSLWMMPQGTRQDGESMRQAAERVAASQCGLEHWRLRFMGNAPSGCFKYVYPTTIQDEKGVKGAKIFFFKARLMDKDITINREIVEDHAWVTVDEMGSYLTPVYRETISKFIMPIVAPE